MCYIRACAAVGRALKERQLEKNLNFLSLPFFTVAARLDRGEAIFLCGQRYISLCVRDMCVLTPPVSK